MKIGFVGQGYVGRSYADDFERRGYSVVRYALEEPYTKNKNKIVDCDVVFVAVPTPTTPQGFDISAVRDALSLVDTGKVAVIKSTILPGTTAALQQEYRDLFLLHSPEFLSRKTADHDATNPARTIIGIPNDSPEHQKHAELVLSILPRAPYSRIMRAHEAELLKYSGNCFYYTKVLYMNILYDLAESLDADFETLKEAITADPFIATQHLDPIHDSGRGAGGDCFIKDFAAFRELAERSLTRKEAREVLRALETLNTHLLRTTNKDLHFLEETYGKNAR